MNKKYVLSSLNKIANELDNNSLFDEANEITEIMHKLVTSQYTGPGSTMEGVSRKRRQTNLTGEIERFENRSEREKNKPTDQQVKRYKDIINYAKNSLYESSMKPEQIIKIMNDYMFKQYDIADLTTAQMTALKDQWNRIKKNYLDSVDKKPKVENVTLKPATGKDIVMDMIDQFSPRRMFRLNDLPKVDVIVDESNSQKSDDEKRAKLATYLNRWVNKAENIYKAWSSKPAASRNTRDTIGLISDIKDYMQSMEDQINPRFKSMVSTKKSDVVAILTNLSSGSSMPTLTPKPYSEVKGYPSKKPSEFGTGERLTGNKLKEQARLETREF